MDTTTTNTTSSPTGAAALTEARQHLSEFVDDVSTSGSVLVITRHGEPAAVLMGHDEYEALIESLNVLSDDHAMTALAEADSDIATGELVDLADA